jgi:hypothetical protein
MKAEYDLSKMQARPNPHASKLKMPSDLEKFQDDLLASVRHRPVTGSPTTE